MSPAKKTTAKRPHAKTTAKRATAKPRPTPTRGAGRVGDWLVVHSARVGTPEREGEILEVVQGAAGVSYWVRWPDGRRSFITPASGSAHVRPASGTN